MTRALVFVSFILILFSCQPATDAAEAVTETVEEAVKTNTMPEKLLRHVVLFQFKADAAPEDIKKVEEAFAALPGKIPEIVDFEWGTNNSPEGLNDGLTHCFLVSFASEEGRATYLPHPAHKEFVEILGPHLEKATVIDYWN